MKKVISKTLTPAQKAQLKRLQALHDADIDTSDIPEQRDWAGARRGLFFRPIKQQLTLRLDADLIGEWRWVSDPHQRGLARPCAQAGRQGVAVTTTR